jgi:D-lactate dehydrogenase (cytochrome)
MIGSPHSVVVHVFSTEDVVKVVGISRNHNVPLVVYSGGTALEASQTAVRIDLAKSKTQVVMF